MDHYKKKFAEILEKAVKNRPIITIIVITSGHSSFKISA